MNFTINQMIAISHASQLFPAGLTASSPEDPAYKSSKFVVGHGQKFYESFELRRRYERVLAAETLVKRGEAPFSQLRDRCSELKPYASAYYRRWLEAQEDDLL